MPKNAMRVLMSAQVREDYRKRKREEQEGIKPAHGAKKGKKGGETTAGASGAGAKKVCSRSSSTVTLVQQRETEAHPAFYSSPTLRPHSSQRPPQRPRPPPPPRNSPSSPVNPSSTSTVASKTPSVPPSQQPPRPPMPTRPTSCVSSGKNEPRSMMSE